MEKKCTTVCLSISNWDCIPSGYRRAVVRSSLPVQVVLLGARTRAVGSSIVQLFSPNKILSEESAARISVCSHSIVALLGSIAVRTRRFVAGGFLECSSANTRKSIWICANNSRKIILFLLRVSEQVEIKFINFIIIFGKISCRVG